MSNLQKRIADLERSTPTNAPGARLVLITEDEQVYHTPQGKTYAATELQGLREHYEVLTVYIPANGR